MKLKITQLWVAEWSYKQGFFHINPADSTIATSLRHLMDGKPPPDYVPIGIFSTHEEASAFLEDMRPHLEKARINAGLATAE